MKECSQLLNYIVLQVGVVDRWVWRLNSSTNYSVSSTYQFLATTTHDILVESSNNLWTKTVPLKVNIFVWRLRLNRIPTKDNLLR